MVCRRLYGRLRKRRGRAPLIQRADAVWDRKQVAELSDGYVRQLLSTGTGIPSRWWPAELVKLKRATVLAKRAMWRTE